MLVLQISEVSWADGVVTASINNSCLRYLLAERRWKCLFTWYHSCQTSTTMDTRSSLSPPMTGRRCTAPGGDKQVEYQLSPTLCCRNLRTTLWQTRLRHVAINMTAKLLN